MDDSTHRPGRSGLSLLVTGARGGPVVLPDHQHGGQFDVVRLAAAVAGSERSVRRAVAAMAASGWRTVVRAGAAQDATGTSSKPTTLRSSGARSPRSRGTWSTPNASAVIAQATTAVGGLVSPSSSAAWARPPATVKYRRMRSSSGLTGCLQGGAIASSRAWLDHRPCGPPMIATRRSPSSIRCQVDGHAARASRSCRPSGWHHQARWTGRSPPAGSGRRPPGAALRCPAGAGREQRASSAPGSGPVQTAGELLRRVHGGGDHADVGLVGRLHGSAQQFLGPGAVQVRDQQVDHPEAEPGGRPGSRALPGAPAIRARVPAATSVRPLSTLETINTDTPAPAAISTRVLRRWSRATRGSFSKMCLKVIG